ncbi:hypothetical protein [Fibrisoma limi]|nr:hypothetical protein [Fibrisoma limi]
MSQALPLTDHRTTMNVNDVPPFRQYFDGLVAQKKQTIHKASDQDAFDAAVKHVAEVFGFVPDFEFAAWKARKNARKLKNSPEKGKKLA